MVEHAFITSGVPEGRDSARGFALGRVTALGLPKRDERIRPWEYRSFVGGGEWGVPRKKSWGAKYLGVKG